MIRRLVLEARIVAPHSFRNSADKENTVEEQECQTSLPSLATGQFSHSWIEEEALSLLKTIKKEVSTKVTANRGKVLLAGYGLGGLVVKQVLNIPFSKSGS